MVAEIRNSLEHAIILETKGRNTIEGNYIGTDVSGTDSRSNDFGIQVGKGSSRNTIGGRKKASRNLISGNGDYGININGNGTSGNVVQGNFIGIDVTGTKNLIFFADFAAKKVISASRRHLPCGRHLVIACSMTPTGQMTTNDEQSSNDGLF
ncbi:MAG: hypothetical protein ACE5IY_21880 [bacterium]